MNTICSGPSNFWGFTIYCFSWRIIKTKIIQGSLNSSFNYTVIAIFLTVMQVTKSNITHASFFFFYNLNQSPGVVITCLWHVFINIAQGSRFFFFNKFNIVFVQVKSDLSQASSSPICCAIGKLVDQIIPLRSARRMAVSSSAPPIEFSEARYELLLAQAEVKAWKTSQHSTMKALLMS